MSGEASGARLSRGAVGAARRDSRGDARPSIVASDPAHFHRAAPFAAAARRRSSGLPGLTTPGAFGLPDRGTSAVKGARLTSISGEPRRTRNGAKGSQGRAALPGSTALSLRSRSAVLPSQTNFHLSADAGTGRAIPASSHQLTTPVREAGEERSNK